MSLIIRNIQLYFRDLPAVIMSLLAEVIIMILYIMFIRDNLLSSFAGIKNIESIVDAWMISGILGITPVTAAMGAYGVMVEDKSKHIVNDFKTSPISSATITLGYVLSATFAGIILSIIVLLLGEGYMFVTYGNYAAEAAIRLFGLIILNSLCVSAIVVLPVIFVKTNNALAGCCTIIGALIGFLTGIYLPMGAMGNTAQVIVRNFPVSHGVVLFRQLLTENEINKAGELQGDMYTKFIEHMGIVYFKDGVEVYSNESIIILILSATVCLSVTIIIKEWMR